jgi:hypothetical protein
VGSKSESSVSGSEYSGSEYTTPWKTEDLSMKTGVRRGCQCVKELINYVCMPPALGEARVTDVTGRGVLLYQMPQTSGKSPRSVVVCGRPYRPHRPPDFPLSVPDSHRHMVSMADACRPIER